LLFNFGGNGGGFSMYHRYQTSDQTQASMNAWAAWVGTTWGDDMAAQCPAAYSLESVTATDLSSRMTPVGVSTTVVPGALPGTAPPDNCCMVVSFKTGVRYRGGHPRAYMPPLTGGFVTAGNTWTAVDLTAFNTAVQAWFTALNNFSGNIGNITHVAVSYFSGHTWNTDGPPWKKTPVLKDPPDVYNVLSVVGNARIGSQRRRLLLGT
jgi:hypothetical protein